MEAVEATEDLRTPDEAGRTPMYRACVVGDLDRMKRLHGHGRMFEHQKMTVELHFIFRAC
jgi:hypothetical protein